MKNTIRQEQQQKKEDEEERKMGKLLPLRRDETKRNERDRERERERNRGDEEEAATERRRRRTREIRRKTVAIYNDWPLRSAGRLCIPDGQSGRYFVHLPYI